MASEIVLNGRYRLVAVQGNGGMAVIYKATDQLLGRTVAVKILRPSLTHDPAFLARFRNEARSVANLSHPNIVTVHDVGSDGQTHYIVMEFIEGLDLKKIIKAHGALPIDRAINLAIQMCAGIGFAHRAGLVHADVKPQNILLSRDDLVKVTDFGIAQAFSETQPAERQSIVWGSPHYFAPEQARGEKPTPASDVYSIGIVMFEMLTGQLPYSGASQQELAMAHIKDRIPLMTEINPSIPENLARIVYKTMSKEPSARYRLADQLGNILVSYRDRGRDDTVNPARPAPVTQQRAEIPPPPPPPSQQQTYPSPYPYSQPQNPPLAGVDPLPTQRYGLAPNAPRQPQPQPQPVSPYAAGRSFTGNTSQQFPPLGQSQRLQTPTESEPLFDALTIVLAFLALLSVACLIPLYIAVFQARAGL